MKIKELLPDELVTAAKNMIRGQLTDADQSYIKSKCGFTIEQLYFCDDGSLELEVIGPQGSQTIDLDKPQTRGYEWILRNYSSMVFMQLLKHLSSQLPEWVYDESQFRFDWCSLQEETLDQFNTAYDEVWSMVFDGARPAWRVGKEPTTRLEHMILDQMFDNREGNGLPTWLRDNCVPVTFEANFVQQLQDVYPFYLRPQMVESSETYVSPV